jgi:hypothetical protein
LVLVLAWSMNRFLAWIDMPSFLPLGPIDNSSFQFFNFVFFAVEGGVLKH